MRMLRLAIPILGAGLLVAACSGGGAASPASTAAPSAAPTAAPSEPAASEPAASAPVAGGPTINLGETTLGSVLVDGAGLTLYIFTADSAGASACTGDCLANWPALAGGAAPTLGAGLDAAAFGTITRPDDGSAQVTFNGMPLYYFAGDTAVGDVKGQGLNDKWYVIGADGTPIK
jgi:predicted lipoprotein with Yx(FWY)xxD motif